MIYAMLFPGNTKDLIQVESDTCNVNEILTMVAWCVEQGGDGKFDYFYVKGVYLPPTWYFTETKDASLFVLRWL